MERILLSLIILFVYAVEVVSFSFGNPLCSSHDSIALLQFKHSLNLTDDGYCESSYPKMASWNMSSMDCCRWDGVTCNLLTGHVIGLDLSCSRLGGTLHPNSSLFQLRHLQTLDLSLSGFWGSQFPQEISQLVSLTDLNLSYCWFKGRIPLEISHLSSLVSLDLSNNFDVEFSQEGFNMLFQNLTKLEILSLYKVNISSSIPMNLSFSSSLRCLDLESTNLQGDLPTNIFLLPKLETLRLSRNYPTVSLPEFNWSSSTHSLRELHLSFNNVSGGILNSLGNTFKALKILRLSGCNLAGPFPEFIGNLSQITQLDLSDNYLEGEIPDFFSNLQKLTSLSLENNHFTGRFPSSLVNLTKLEDLSLRNNSLSGTLPPFTASRLQNLIYLDLSENSLNGSIPSWMTSLPSLIQLLLGRNRFSEPLPEFKTNSIEELYLSHNQFSGLIPQSLGDLLNLTAVYLEQNKLSGEIGEEMFSSMTNLQYLDLSRSGLSWSSNINTTFPLLRSLRLGSCRVKDFPDFLLNSKELWVLDLSENEIHGQLP